MGDSKSDPDGEREIRPERDGATRGDGGDPAEPLSFEGALERLEGTVNRLEAGEMPLEEALDLFESGVKLSRQCQETLQAAEQRIEILVADRDAGAGDWETQGFESDSNFEDEPEEIED